MKIFFPWVASKSNTHMNLENSHTSRDVAHVGKKKMKERKEKKLVNISNPACKRLLRLRRGRPTTVTSVITPVLWPYFLKCEGGCNYLEAVQTFDALSHAHPKFNSPSFKRGWNMKYNTKICAALQSKKTPIWEPWLKREINKNRHWF